MAKTKQLSKSQYEMLAAFRYALRQFLHFSEEAAHAAGITPQQHQALLAVKGFRGRDCVTVGELAERLQLRHHSAVGLVDRLVAEGLMVSLGYLDAYRSAWLPANLIQAQRDYFGAHTYERVDSKGTFHTQWEEG